MLLVSSGSFIGNDPYYAAWDFIAISGGRPYWGLHVENHYNTPTSPAANFASVDSQGSNGGVTFGPYATFTAHDWVVHVAPPTAPGPSTVEHLIDGVVEPSPTVLNYGLNPLGAEAPPGPVSAIQVLATVQLSQPDDGSTCEAISGPVVVVGAPYAPGPVEVQAWDLASGTLSNPDGTFTFPNNISIGAGGLMFICLTADDSNASYSGTCNSPGWTLLANQISADATQAMAILYKVSSGAEPGSYTFTVWNGANNDSHRPAYYMTSYDVPAGTPAPTATINATAAASCWPSTVARNWDPGVCPNA